MPFARVTKNALRQGGELTWPVVKEAALTAVKLARIFHESPAVTTDMDVLPGVLECRTLRRTVQVRLGTNTLRLHGGTPIFAVSRQQFMKYSG
jgi:hypothetical protein